MSIGIEAEPPQVIAARTAGSIKHPRESEEYPGREIIYPPHPLHGEEDTRLDRPDGGVYIDAEEVPIIRRCPVGGDGVLTGKTDTSDHIGIRERPGPIDPGPEGIDLYEHRVEIELERPGNPGGIGVQEDVFTQPEGLYTDFEPHRDLGDLEVDIHRLHLDGDRIGVPAAGVAEPQTKAAGEIG